MLTTLMILTVRFLGLVGSMGFAAACWCTNSQVWPHPWPNNYEMCGQSIVNQCCCRISILWSLHSYQWFDNQETIADYQADIVQENQEHWLWVSYAGADHGGRTKPSPVLFFFLTIIPNFLNNKYVLKHQGSSKDHFHLEEYKVFQNSGELGTPLWFSRTSCVWRPSSTPRLHRSLSLWSKRGHLCLTKPDWDPVMALTIHMDMSRNPGPNSVAETI